MDKAKTIIKAHLLWVILGVLFLGAVVFRLVWTGGIYSETDKTLGLINNQKKVLQKTARDVKTLPNRNWITEAKQEVEDLKAQQKGFHDFFSQRHAILERYFSSEVNTTSSDLPDPNEFKEYYRREITALAKSLGSSPVKTGLSVEEGSISPGCFQINTNLFGTGRIAQSEIATEQTRYWLQMDVLKATLATSCEIYELENAANLKRAGIAPAKRKAASDGSIPRKEWDEVVYKKTLRVSALNKIEIENSGQYDANGKFKIYNIAIDANMQLSLLPFFLKQLMASELALVQIRSYQISNSVKTIIDTEATTATRYKEPSVNVLIKCSFLDWGTPPVKKSGRRRRKR